MKLKVHKTPAAIIDKMAIDAHNFNINSVKLHPITIRGPIIGNFLQKFSISIISICRRYASNLSIFSLSKSFWGGFGRDNFQNVPPKSCVPCYFTVSASRASAARLMLW